MPLASQIPIDSLVGREALNQKAETRCPQDASTRKDLPTIELNPWACEKSLSSASKMFQRVSVSEDELAGCMQERGWIYLPSVYTE
jgi:hypothetical protein